MNVISSCSVEEVSSLSPLDLEVKSSNSKIQELVVKVNAIWARAYQLAIVSGVKVVSTVRSAIGCVVRDAFFFPLKCSLIMNIPFIREQLKIEEQYFRDFCIPQKPLDPNFRDQALVREVFGIREDRAIPIQLPDGRMIQITCRVMQSESAEENQSFYNFAHIPGIQSTISNDIGGIYPYLASYVTSKEAAERQGGSFPPGRFMIISENNLEFIDEKGVKRPYKSVDLAEAGFVLAEVLSALKKEFGDFDQVVAHSLGCIVFSNALKYLVGEDLFSKNICLDRGPLSIWEISKKYFFGLGRILYPFVKFTHWTSDIEQDVVDFCDKRLEQKKVMPSVLIAGVEKDSHFADSANLCLGKKIQQLQERGVLNVLFFSPPLQVFHENANHSLRADFLNARYLIGKSDRAYINSNENFAESIVRHSFGKREGLVEFV